MKLTVKESGWRQTREFLAGGERVVSSEIAEVEVVRAARRVADERGVEAARRVLRAITLVELDQQARRRAMALDPLGLRALDAIHLATAVGLHLADLVFVGYDRRLQEAAAAAGLEIQSPGA